MSEKHAEQKPQASEIMMFGVIWGMVGAIYSALFLIFLEILIFIGYQNIAMPLAGLLAGGLGAAFYGAMQVAFMGTIAGVLATFGYLVAIAESNVHPLEVFIVAGVAGTVLGAGFGALDRFLIRGSLAKALSGMLGGLIAASLTWPFTLWLHWPVPIWLTAGILVAVTGYIYVASVERMERIVGGHIPYPVRGAILGGSLAGVIGVTVWAVGGTVTGTVDPTVMQAIETAGTLIPHGVAGGTLGGILAGSLIAYLGLTPKG